MNKIILPVIEVLLTLFLILMALGGSMKILQDKQSVRKYREFYETPNEYDVLYFGSSHMMQTALPMEIWKKYGIRSYNMGNGTENIAVSYQVIKNTLDYCSPRVIMLDVYNSFDDQTVNEQQENMFHLFFDMVKFDSPHKITSGRDGIICLTFPFTTPDGMSFQRVIFTSGTTAWAEPLFPLIPSLREILIPDGLIPFQCLMRQKNTWER